MNQVRTTFEQSSEDSVVTNPAARGGGEIGERGEVLDRRNEYSAALGKASAPAAKLTRREREVLRLLSLGCSVREAATLLALACSTVDNYKSTVMRKLGIRKNVLLTRFAIKSGISGIDDELSLSEQHALRRSHIRDGEIDLRREILVN